MRSPWAHRRSDRLDQRSGGACYGDRWIKGKGSSGQKFRLVGVKHADLSHPSYCNDHSGIKNGDTSPLLIFLPCFPSRLPAHGVQTQRIDALPLNVKMLNWIQVWLGEVIYSLMSISDAVGH